MSQIALIASRVSKNEETPKDNSFDERVLAIEGKLEAISSAIDGLKSAVQELKTEEPEDTEELSRIEELCKNIHEKKAIFPDYTKDIDQLRANIQTVENIVLSLRMKEEKDYTQLLTDIITRLEAVEKRPQVIQKTIDLNGLEFDIIRRFDDKMDRIKLRK